MIEFSISHQYCLLPSYKANLTTVLSSFSLFVTPVFIECLPCARNCPLYAVTHLVISLTLWGGHWYPHFTDEKTGTVVLSDHKGWKCHQTQTVRCRNPHCQLALLTACQWDISFSKVIEQNIYEPLIYVSYCARPWGFRGDQGSGTWVQIISLHKCIALECFPDNSPGDLSGAWALQPPPHYTEGSILNLLWDWAVAWSLKHSRIFNGRHSRHVGRRL